MASDRGVQLEVADLAFDYGRRAVLRDVEARAEPGQVVGLVGPNGSGKSTLLKILSAVLPDYRGSARIDGQEVGMWPRRELARRIAVVPQEVSFGFPFTALQVVLMGRHPHLAGLAFESAADIECAHEALERCDALGLADRVIHELSSGERQRILFAKALTQQPRGLLLDEPVSFLDIRHQVDLYDIVRELAAEGRTVVTALHDLNLAAEYCDKIYLLRGGRVVAGGAAAEVLTYANLTEVFETEVYVDTNALTGKLLVTPLSGRVRQQLRSGDRSRPSDAAPEA
ncbi:MAG: ABC transporter ATP-binding protein [Planctomycetota bacterium]